MHSKLKQLRQLRLSHPSPSAVMVKPTLVAVSAIAYETRAEQEKVKWCLALNTTPKAPLNNNLTSLTRECQVDTS